MDTTYDIVGWDGPRPVTLIDFAQAVYKLESERYQRPRRWALPPDRHLELVQDVSKQTQYLVRDIGVKGMAVAGVKIYRLAEDT